MGAVKSKLAQFCSPQFACCGPCKSGSYDIEGFARPPRLGTDEDVEDATREGVLIVQGIDFCIEANGTDHHTSQFHLMVRKSNRCLVVRRGQAFKLHLVLNRPFDPSKDALSFIFHVSDVENGGPSDDATAAVPLLEKGSETTGLWSAIYKSQSENHLMVSITTVADCIVASWNLEVDSRLMGGNSLSYKHPLPIYILFNPWCPHDDVYMSAEAHRNEYVMSDGGLMFRGVYNRIKPSPWSFAQFERDILDCALYLIKKIGRLKGRVRNDPIRTVRALSAAVNVQDDDGVIIGNWSSDPNDYGNGTHPLKWIGSAPILQKYYEKKNPVRYGQCWVYAGVLTTVCRAIGIPCRPVSGFNAAHDSQGSLTIDTIMDEDGNILDEFSRDSIWNYHVWNEVWMKRPDLGAEYAGWQVIDGTPQETSDDMYRCGPTSLRAVKEGELYKPYDVTYVLAEVNADKVTWKYFGKIQPLKLVYRDEVSIGKNLSTKAVGKMEREDLTLTYKYPERSHKERMTMEKALRQSQSHFARYYLNEAFNDIKFDFELNDDIKIGQEFSVIVRIINRSASNSHQVRGILRVDTSTYTGVTGKLVKTSEFNMDVAPRAKQNVTMLVTFNEYYKKLIDQGSFNIACIATIVDKEYDYIAQDTFRVRNPDIKISIQGEVIAQQQITVYLRLQNPLPIPLTNGKFYVNVAGLENTLKIRLKSNVPSDEFATASFKLTPPWEGKQQITAKFKASEMQDADGFLIFTVLPGTN